MEFHGCFPSIGSYLATLKITIVLIQHVAVFIKKHHLGAIFKNITPSPNPPTTTTAKYKLQLTSGYFFQNNPKVYCVFLFKQL